MKNTNKGFVGIALIIILAVALTAGGTYYVTTKKNVDLQINSTSTQTQNIKTPESQEINPVAIKAPSASVSTGVNVSAPTIGTTNPKISWSFNTAPAGQESSTKVTLNFDGKAYDAGTYPGGCINVSKSSLVNNQISAVACEYAGLYIISVVKNGDSYSIVNTTADGSTEGGVLKVTDRFQSETILKIK